MIVTEVILLIVLINMEDIKVNFKHNIIIYYYL